MANAPRDLLRRQLLFESGSISERKVIATTVEQLRLRGDTPRKSRLAVSFLRTIMAGDRMHRGVDVTGVVGCDDIDIMDRETEAICSDYGKVRHDRYGMPIMDAPEVIDDLLQRAFNLLFRIRQWRAAKNPEMELRGPIFPAIFLDGAGEEFCSDDGYMDDFSPERYMFRIGVSLGRLFDLLLEYDAERGKAHQRNVQSMQNGYIATFGDATKKKQIALAAFDQYMRSHPNGKVEAAASFAAKEARTSVRQIHRYRREMKTTDTR